MGITMRLPGGHSVALGALLATCGCASGRDSLLEPAVCLAPVVTRSAVAANPTNALSILVTATVRFADSVAVLYGASAALDSATPAFVVSGDSVVLPVLGLYQRRGYGVEVMAFNRCATTVGTVMSFTTGSLPNDLPAYSAVGHAVRGYVVLAAGNYGLVLDNTGRVVWYHRFPNGPGLNFQPQPDGRYAARPPVAAGQVASWVEIDPSGNVARTLGCARNLSPRMHDMIAQTDGSYWLLCDEVRTLDLSAQGRAAQAHVMGTAVQRRSALGDVLFEWSPFEHLDVDLSVLEPADLSGPVINWTHGNALDLDGDGNLLVSFRNLNEVTKIDTHTGAVLWQMGGTANQFIFENVGFRHQHGVRAAGAGRLILLDNLGDPDASYARRIEFDDAHYTARMSSWYLSTPGVIAQTGGSVQSLPDGHTLVSFGSGGAVDEYDAAGSVVWRLEGKPGYVFRATRIRSLYQPGVGDPR